MGDHNHLYISQWVVFPYGRVFTYLMTPLDKLYAEHINVILHTSYVWMEEVANHSAE